MKNRNIILGAILSVLTCFVLSPQMQAASGEGPSVPDTFSGSNTFDGFHALFSQTSNSFNSAFGWQSLLSQTTATAVTGCGAGTLVFNTADNNTAVGAAALLFNTTATANVAVGGFSLLQNTTGAANTAVGMQALQNNQAGVTNTGLGRFAAQNTAANFNTAVGGFALQANVGGARNTAVGAGAMESANGGDDNTAIGELAGNSLGSGSSNIVIGSGVAGTADENNSIRVGTNLPSGGIAVVNTGPLANVVTMGPGTSTEGITILTLLGFGSVAIGNGLQTTNGASSCFVGGIYNQNPTGGSHAVQVGPDNKLADATLSSRRFKRDIAPIDKLSEGILALKPVTFHWKADKTNEPEFGLVAEDVAEVNLDWITRNPQGEVTGVRYDTIPILLLNEFLKEHKKVEEQQASISQLKSEMQTMIAQLKEQAAQIQKVSAQLEVSKPAPQVVTSQK
jgi:Chaperone of endosialidase